VSSRPGEVINPWDKIKFVSFYLKNYLPWVKGIFLSYFPQEGCSLFYLKKAGHFLPQEGKKKINRLLSEFE